MNKDYLEYQYSKSKKLTERAFKLRIAMLMVSILACAGIMASSAFALFKCDINRSTTLTAAQFEVLGWNPIQQTSDDINITHIVDIYTTPGVLGYCRIPVYSSDNTIHYYFTEAFSNGHMQVSIATAGGASVGKPEGYWGNPRNFLGPEAEIIGNGALVTHSYAAPENESASGGGGQDVSQENNDDKTDNKQIVDKTENNDEVIKTPMLSVSPSVNKEQTTVTENVVTETETPVTPSVSEEKASVENSNSTVTEAPVTSTPPSGNNSDSGTTDATGNSGNDGSSGTGTSSDSGTSSGTEASTGGATEPVSDGGGE